MQDRYFSSFRFEDPKPLFSVIPIERKIQPSLIRREVEVLDNLYEDVNGVDFEVIEEPTLVWDRRSVRRIFRQQLVNISQAIEEPALTMDRRRLRFVAIGEMRPQTEEQRQWLVDNYGEYMRDGGGGDCSLNEDGTFNLRVAWEGNLTRMTDNELSVAAHEYGHTLGGFFIKEAVYEELKADAFESLFMKRVLGAASYDISTGYASTVHEIARFKLGQLVRVGIPEEAVIAHLIDQNFGRFNQDDYTRFIPTDRLVSQP